MLATVQTPYADTRAGQLALRLGLPPQPAVDVLEVPLPGGAVELRLLGASHQVRVLQHDVALSEVVACGHGDDRPLPPHACRDLGGATYRFRSEVTRHPPSRLAGIALRLRSRFAGNRHAIVGVYPGSPHAVTAVVAEPGASPRWRTWHLYPQTGEVVVTRTVLERR